MMNLATPKDLATILVTIITVMTNKYGCCTLLRLEQLGWLLQMDYVASMNAWKV